MLPVLSLSNVELVESFNRLHHDESTLMVLLLEHLAEIEKRGLHLADGYSSMFEYLQKKYHYSASATWRRLTSARALSKFPQLRSLLETRELNLSTLSRVAQSLTTDNAAELIEMVRGKSEKEVQKILLTLNLKVPGGSRISKKQLEKERIRMVAVVDDKIQSEECENDALDLFSDSREQGSAVGHTQALFTTGSEQSEADNSESQSAVEIAYRIELGIDEELKAKMERIRLKLSARYPQGASYRELIETLADYYLKREDKENASFRQACETAITSGWEANHIGFQSSSLNIIPGYPVAWIFDQLQTTLSQGCRCFLPSRSEMRIGDLLK